MSILKQSLVEKAGYDNGFEYVLPCTLGVVNLGSAHHFAKVAITILPNGLGYSVNFMQATNSLLQELIRQFSNHQQTDSSFLLANEALLAQFLKRTSELAQSLPNQALIDFEAQVQQALSSLSSYDLQSTEVQRIVRQRVGQDRYRQAMLDYWAGACAVTGLSIQTALRASHAKPWAECKSDAERLDVFNGFLLSANLDALYAKPWAECKSDAERLDVFNGFLLSANLDALFDKFLISFTDQGHLLISNQIPPQDCELLGLNNKLQLRWITPSHLPYLSFHRARFKLVG